MTLTLRNLPPEIVKAIGERARKRGTSASRAVISLLEEVAGAAGGRPSRRLHHDLDALFGTMSKKDAAELEKAVRGQRTIDRELWA